MPSGNVPDISISRPLQKGATCPALAKRKLPIGVEHPAKAGDEAAVAGAHQFGVEAHQDRGGAQAFKSKGAQNTDGKDSRHGGFQALAAHIAHRNDDTAVGPRKDLVEVPTNFLRGQVRGFNVAAGKGRNRYGDQPLLDLPRGFELSCCPFVLKRGAAMAEQEDRANRDQEEEHRQVVVINPKRPTWKSPECGYGRYPALRMRCPAEMRVAADRPLCFRASISIQESPASQR